MTIAQLRCQVLEASPDAWPTRPHRELLPWADPYIAGLIRRLEQKYDVALAEPAGFDGGALDESDWEADLEEGDPRWTDDAFFPAALDFGRPQFEARYGGFPLLDDLAADPADSFEPDTDADCHADSR